MYAYADVNFAGQMFLRHPSLYISFFFFFFFAQVLTRLFHLRLSAANLRLHRRELIFCPPTPCFIREDIYSFEVNTINTSLEYNENISIFRNFISENFNVFSTLDKNCFDIH